MANHLNSPSTSINLIYNDLNASKVVQARLNYSTQVQIEISNRIRREEDIDQNGKYILSILSDVEKLIEECKKSSSDEVKQPQLHQNANVPHFPFLNNRESTFSPDSDAKAKRQYQHRLRRRLEQQQQELQ